MNMRNIIKISALACDITVILIDDGFCVGPCEDGERSSLSALQSLHSPNSQQFGANSNVSRIASIHSLLYRQAHLEPVSMELSICGSNLVDCHTIHPCICRVHTHLDAGAALTRTGQW